VQQLVAVAMELDPEALSWQYFAFVAHQRECHLIVHKILREKISLASDGLDSLSLTNVDSLARMERHRFQDLENKLTKLKETRKVGECFQIFKNKSTHLFPSLDDQLLRKDPSPTPQTFCSELAATFREQSSSAR
jgi:hypothetical protein